jgi:hypothetical protein
VTPIHAPEGAESITEDELEQYFQRVQSVRNVMGGASLEAARIVRDIKAHREPEYEPGRIYQDASRQPFYRCPDGSWLWLPESKPFSDHTPNRPLRKLVPEPSRDAIYATLANGAVREWSYYEVRDTIVAGLELGQSTEQIASEICELVNGVS